MRLQQWSHTHGQMLNAHPFGQDLHSLLWHGPAFDLLPPDYGWLDGGCLLLARGLELWSRGELKPICWGWPDESSPEGLCVSHYAMHLDFADGEAAVLDGNGLGTLEDFSASMLLEHEFARTRGQMLDPDQSALLYRQACCCARPEFEANLPAGDDRPLLLCKQLQRQLGDFEIDRVLLAWPESEAEVDPDFHRERPTL